MGGREEYIIHDCSETRSAIESDGQLSSGDVRLVAIAHVHPAALFGGPLLTSIDDASTIYLGETQSCWGRKKKEKIVRIYLGCPRNCFFSFRIGLFKEMEEN